MTRRRVSIVAALLPPLAARAWVVAALLPPLAAYAGVGIVAALLLPLAACAGEGIVDPTAPAPLCTDVAPFRPELHCIQQLVFTPTCAVSGCHANPGVNLGLDLTEGRSYMNIVGVTSVEDPNIMRIAAGDPDASYLIRKLRGDPTILFDRMPFGGPYLSDAEIDVIEQWVLDGAPDN